MAEDLGAQAVELLIEEALENYGGGRYQAAVEAASRAAEAARLLDDPVLLVCALEAEAGALMMTGDSQAALADFTQILGLAKDQASSDRLDDPRVTTALASAHWNWVECARDMTGIPVRELFRVLDAAERWLAAVGRPDWRAAVLNQRARTYRRLGESDAAIALAEEALAVKTRHPDAPGYTLATHRFTLGDILREAGRVAEAAAQYQAILTDTDERPWGRCVAHQGLAWCALAVGDPDTAHREAVIATRLAEPLGDEALCDSLEVLAEASRIGQDPEAAWQAASRFLEAARRIGNHVRLYDATRKTVDVALDRADLSAAERLLGEMEEHGAAVDASAGITAKADETARRRRRLADLSRLPDA